MATVSKPARDLQAENVEVIETDLPNEGDLRVNFKHVGAKFMAALSKAQSKLTPVPKDTNVDVMSQKTGKRYKFRYASMPAIWKVIQKPFMLDNGFSVVQFPDNNMKDKTVSVFTLVMHESGEWMSGWLTLACYAPDPQGVGSVISYARRYSISAMLGVTQEDENEEEVLSQDRDERSFGPPPQSSQRPPTQAAPSPAQLPPASPKLGESDLEQQMTCCANIDELSRVAALVKLHGFKGESRARLLKVYAARAKELKTGGVH